ncbi:Endonuclease III [Paramyrothecium foliicola]|nr:Endonuclease III [Paramyrothecium foliicola]
MGLSRISNMRTSRVSKDTSKLFNRDASSVPRRTTRASLARFALATSSNSDGDVRNVDIEDLGGPPAKRRKRSPSSPIANKIKIERVDDVTLPPSPPAAKAPRRARKPAHKTTDAATGEESVAPPSDWEEMYNAVRKMRAPGGPAHGAAVDTMGCERLADRQASEKDQRFHTLISLMMSSQTKDTVNAVVMKKLQTQLPAYKPGAPVGLNLDNILAVDPTLLNEMIWAVGFHNNKTKYIKQAAEIMRDKWDGDIPDTIEGLTSLPGVGPKMAYLCMTVAWNRVEGIGKTWTLLRLLAINMLRGVDTHVQRLVNLWGWHKTKNPEETRLALQSWLPHDKWREINHLLVGFGQTVCLPVGRKCGECDLGLQGLCKAAERKKVIEGRRIKNEEIKLEADGTIVKTQQVKEEMVVKEEVVNEAMPR